MLTLDIALVVIIAILIGFAVLAIRKNRALLAEVEGLEELTESQRAEILRIVGKQKQMIDRALWAYLSAKLNRLHVNEPNGFVEIHVKVLESTLDAIAHANEHAAPDTPTRKDLVDIVADHIVRRAVEKTTSTI